MLPRLRHCPHMTAVVPVTVHREGQAGSPSSEHWLCVWERPETRGQIAPGVSCVLSCLLLGIH